MRYLLVYEHLERGGIETLITRMGNWLVRNSHEVILYVERTGPMLELLDSEVKVITPDNKFRFIYNPKKIVALFGDKQIDCLYTFGPKSCLTGGIIYSSLKNRHLIKFFSGIYHPREFNIRGTITLRGLILLNFYKNYLGKGTRVFMSESVKEDIQKVSRRPFGDSRIWPLALNIPDETFQGKPNRIKIVSIGRYVEFKNYNLYMFDVVKNLLNEGLAVTWEVYGHGPLKSKMLELSNAEEFQGNVKVLGEIEYEMIPTILKDAFVFIGMGTALLEAGSYGVPCIPSIAYSNSPYSYGYLYDLPYYACGEKLDAEPSVSIVSLIKDLYSCNTAEYEEHRIATKKYVTEYSIDTLMSKFVDFSGQEDRSVKVKKYPLLFSYFYILVSYYSSLRYKLALRKRWSSFKSLFRIKKD